MTIIRETTRAQSPTRFQNQTPPREVPPREVPPREVPPREVPPREAPPREVPPRETFPGVAARLTRTTCDDWRAVSKARAVSTFARVVVGACVVVAGGCASPVAPPPLAMAVVSPGEKARQSLGLTARETRLEFRPQPALIVARSPALWSLKVLETKRKADGKSDYVRSFASDHNQLMHLIVVSRDLSFFKHLKPDYKDYGHFLIETTLPAPGRYQLFADYTPYKGGEEVARQQLVVAPAQAAAPAAASSNDALVASSASSTDADSVLRADAMKNNRIIKQIAPVGLNAPGANALNETVSNESPSSQTVSSYGARGQVTLALGGSATRDQTSRANVVAGRETTLHFQLRDSDGSALADSDLDDSASQCFIVSGDGAIYLHPRGIVQKSKAQMSAAEIDFPVRFPAPGLYKIWFEFYLRDELLVAPFVLNVAAPPVPAA